MSFVKAEPQRTDPTLKMLAILIWSTLLVICLILLGCKCYDRYHNKTKQRGISRLDLESQKSEIASPKMKSVVVFSEREPVYSSI